MSRIATAVFDLQGRNLHSSVEFLTLLQRRELVEDLLALPRALALRTACGYSAVPDGPLAVRRFWLHGSLHTVRPQLLVGDDAPTGALVLTVTQD